MTLGSLKPRVLIVDDDESFRNLICDILTPQGYEVVQAEDVVVAEKVMSGEPGVDVALLDIVMPGESGMKFLERLERNNNNTPIVMITGFPQMDTAVESFKHGAVDYLSKPITIEQLVNSVEKAIDVHATSAGATMVLDASPRTIAGYEIIRTVGEGNMGIVYLVEGEDAKGVRKQYAMKVLKPFIAENDKKLENVKKRFLVEARAAFSIQHPNIVQVHDYGSSEDNTPYILMEFCAGKPLDYLIETQDMSLRDKCHILRQIAFALDAIHENDICHRDIKPANIIVDSDFTAKLTDFGIARLRDSNLTMTSEVFGTPAYLSPEAFTSAKVNFRADIFSFGSLAYELFTGQRAFDGPTIASVARQIRQVDPVWPRRRDKTFPRQLDAMLRKMLRKKPNDRYDSAFEIYMEINAFLDREEAPRQESPGLLGRLMGH